MAVWREWLRLGGKRIAHERSVEIQRRPMDVDGWIQRRSSKWQLWQSWRRCRHQPSGRTLRRRDLAGRVRQPLALRWNWLRSVELDQWRTQRLVGVQRR